MDLGHKKKQNKKIQRYNLFPLAPVICTLLKTQILRKEQIIVLIFLLKLTWFK